jgi:hypothetical protein
MDNRDLFDPGSGMEKSDPGYGISIPPGSTTLVISLGHFYSGTESVYQKIFLVTNSEPKWGLDFAESPDPI